MCAVSLVMEAWRNPTSREYIAPGDVDPVTAARMLEVIWRLEQIDAKLGRDKDCVISDAEKQAFKNQLAAVSYEDRLE